MNPLNSQKAHISSSRSLKRLAMAWLCALASSLPLHAATSQPPNVILVLVDDMGFADLGCTGSMIPTPNIDRFAAEGVLMPQFYNAAQCCPSRAALLTGLYPHEAGMGNMHSSRAKPVDRDRNGGKAYLGTLHDGTATIAEVLKTGGYQTFMTGKWHVGVQPECRPLARGFDHFFGALEGANWYSKAKLFPKDGKTYSSDAAGSKMMVDDKPFTVEMAPADFHATDAFTDYGIRWIRERDKPKPFFFYLSFNAPHTPYEPKPQSIERVRALIPKDYEQARREIFERQQRLGVIPSHAVLPTRSARGPQKPDEDPDRDKEHEGKMLPYAALLVEVDDNMGKLYEFLKAEGLDKNTVVLFMSDNGAWAARGGQGVRWGETSCAPFRHFKTRVHEGGIRTPLIAWWPGRFPAGKLQVKQYGHFSDVLATIAEMGGVSYPKEIGGRSILPLSGQSLLPALRDPSFSKNRPLGWERLGNCAYRDGDWKLVRLFTILQETDAKDPESVKRDAPWELYNLAADPTETKNLAENEPERLKSMIAAYEQWEKRVGVIDREQVLAGYAGTKTNKE